MANRKIYIYIWITINIYIWPLLCIPSCKKNNKNSKKITELCIFFRIFRHLPWPEESETASSLWHQHSSLGWKKEHRPTPGSSWQETRRGNLEICTEKSCWCYVFMIVLVRFVTSNDLWTSMDFYWFDVFICLHRLCMCGTAHFYWIQVSWYSKC